jgi:hypothetical protein
LADATTTDTTDSGAAYVFVRSGTTWTQQAYLKAFNPGNSALFGGSVAISGETIVVGTASSLARIAFNAVGGEGANNTGVNAFVNAGGAPKSGRTGSVTATQRFGSALNLNLHFHCIFLDGIYTRSADDRLSFRRVVPHTEDIERLVVRIAEACEAWLSRQGFGAEDEGEDDGDVDDAQAVIQQASLLGQAALGDRAGKRARRVQVLGGKELALPPRCASFAGYSLHAGVGFKASDRAGLERLCRYILRPPLTKDRLQRREDGNVVVGLKRVWSDGTSALVFSPSELVERLVALVPPPRANQVIYRGVLAANAAWRAEVVPSHIRDEGAGDDGGRACSRLEEQRGARAGG